MTASASLATRVSRNLGVWARTVCFAAILLTIPMAQPGPYLLHTLILSMIMAALASAWNLAYGYAGIFSFGHQAFWGLGAYVSGCLSVRAGVSPWVGIVVASVSACIVSLIIGVPCLRLRLAPFVSIATLSFAEICRIAAANLVGITRGELGLYGIPPLSASGSRFASYYTMAALLLLILCSMSWIGRSPLGLALRSVREEHDVAEALGIDTDRVRLLAFVLSSSMTGAVGAFYAHYVSIITPSSVLSSSIMVQIVATTLLGGAGTVLGPVVAAFGMTLGLEYFRWLADYRLLLYGAGMIGLVLLMPEGLAPHLQVWIRRLGQARLMRRRRM